MKLCSANYYDKRFNSTTTATRSAGINIIENITRVMLAPHFVRRIPIFNCSKPNQPCSLLSFVRTIKSKTSKTLDSLGEWDSSRDMPLSLDASIAQGRPIPKLDLSNVGVSSVKGRRKYQEDQISMSALGPNLLYLALFDGHGGFACSYYCAHQMHRHISNLIYSRSDLDLVSVLHMAFLEVNNAFARWFTFNHKDDKMQSSGTTATVCLIQDNMQITIAHVGDSRAILCRGGEARKLTTDHAPDLLPEKKRIERSGGEIKNNRVNGRLAMTRSIGDLELKKFGVIAEPEIRLVRISHSRDGFLVLTTDGVNSVMTDQEILETVKQAGDPTEAAHLVTDTAMQYSSEDNITAMVIPLGSWGKYSAAATIFHSFGKSFTSSSRFG